jgi:hypothetical protein
VQFSDALTALAANARDFVAGVHADGHLLSGVLWTPNAVVVSEQALPDASEYEVTIADRSAKALLAGRDEGTNVAVLKLDREIAGPLPPKTGALALVEARRTASPQTCRIGPWGALGKVAGGTIRAGSCWMGASDVRRRGPVLPPTVACSGCRRVGQGVRSGHSGHGWEGGRRASRKGKSMRLAGLSLRRLRFRRH